MEENIIISKNHDLSELDRKIKRILLYKKKIHRDSTCSRILEMMHPDRQLTVSQIARSIGKPRQYTKKIVLHMLHSDGYLLLCDEKTKKRHSRRYLLVDTGRWFAVCVKLDYIPFQSLCILSQAYCRARRDPNDKASSCYMISRFRDAFDR